MAGWIVGLALFTFLAGVLLERRLPQLEALTYFMVGVGVTGVIRLVWGLAEGTRGYAVAIGAVGLGLGFAASRTTAKIRTGAGKDSTGD